ncbi:M56 family metallopeptidase [Anaerobaca lacustris]|uniref:M56 family metallopeptidase n=1 Tax=Anaerobaca lacustris TaxID=3044600 RepID=A0AAW6TUP9_9BACT|nr:M56 family metallopeptidase [Sedimentisphaerales bacterium M17dextr]
MIGHFISETSLGAILLLQSAGFIAAGLAASYLLRRCPARAHRCLLAASVASVLAPASYLLVRHLELGVLPYQRPTIPELETSAPVLADAWVPSDMGLEFVALDATAPAAMPAAVADRRTTSVPWTTVALTCWAACSTVLLVRLLLQFTLGLRLLRTSEPEEDGRVRDALNTARAQLGVRLPVTIARHAKVRSPVIWCWGRPPTLLVHKAGPPLQNRTDWVGVFCHELAHLMRRDHHSGLFAELLTAAIPWHPLTWWTQARLARLSEHACDDWVLAAGQSPADYAESLLHLSPQRRMTFLPTIVGKERTMKARIYRIVKDPHSDPRIGRRWTLTLTSLLILAMTAVALAQREPAPPARSDSMVQGERDERREPAFTGRRNVLERLLDQLIAQAEEAERALQQRGDEPNKETEVLRAELRTLHEQIAAIERQLQTLNRRGRLTEIDDPDREEAREIRDLLRGTQREIDQIETTPNTRRDRELVEHMRALRSRLRELQAQVAEHERRLERLSDPDSERGLDLRRAIENRHREMAAVEEQIQDQETEIATRQMVLRLIAKQRRDEIESRIATNERVLRQQEERGSGGSDGSNELRQRQERIEAIGHDREPDDRVRDLRNRLLELDREVAETRRSWQQSGDPDSEESRNHRAALEQLQRERADVREELYRLDPDLEAWEQERALRVNEELASAVARRIALTEPELLELEQHGRGDTAEANQLRQNLARLHTQARALEARSAARRRDLSPLCSERDPDERRTERRATSSDTFSRYGDPYTRATARARIASPQASPDVQRQVEELRGQVTGLNEQIQQMREMLQQLLERRNRQNVETQEMKVER